MVKAVPSSAPAAEWHLLLAAVRASLDPDGARALGGALRGAIDWTRLRALSERHCVTPLLHALHEHAERVPPQQLAWLRERQQLNAARNRALGGELRRLAARCRAAGIGLIPYKGPETAERVYGDGALRQFKDLDVLVREADIDGLCALLEADGYRFEGVRPRGRRDYNRRQFKDYSFLRDRLPGTEQTLPDLRPAEHPKFQTLIVEPHWSLTARRFHVPIDYVALWARRQCVIYGDLRIDALAPEDLLLTLCINGSKSGWSRLQFVADVAAAARSFSGADWVACLRQARALDAERMVLTGLQLARELLGVPAPAELAPALRRQPRVATLGRRVEAAMIHPVLARTVAPCTNFSWLALLMLERHRHKLKYVYHTFTEPQPWHMARVPLPGALFGLYRPLVPVLNALRQGGRLARALLSARPRALPKG